MKKCPLLSVIVPVYNVEAYLEKCVSSIRNQTYENLEILLVDDGSRDASGAICDRLAAEDSRIRVFHQENQGQGMARNHALEQCRGEYVTFVDSDDWIEPETYRQMLEAMEKTGANVSCCGRFNVSEKTGEKHPGLCPQKAEVLPVAEMLRRMLTWQGCDCSPCDKVFSRAAFGEIRFPEKSGSEDVAILYRVILQAGTTVMVPEPFYNYLQRSASTSYGAVSPKLFQYSQYAGVLYADLCRQLPEVQEAARYFYVRALSWTLMLLDQADPAVRRTYCVQEKQCRTALRKHLGFLLGSTRFGNKERVTDLLLALGWYRGLRRLVHRNAGEAAGGNGRKS